MLVAELCPTLCHPMGCSSPGSSIHGIFQARILEWVAIAFSRGSSQPRDETWVSCTAGRFFTNWATREAPYKSTILMKFQSTSYWAIFFLKHNKVSLKFTWKNKPSALNKICWKGEAWLPVIKMFYKNSANKIAWFGSISSNGEMAFIELNTPSGNN